MSENLITVSQLNRYIYQIFQAEDLLHNILVVGEVSGFSIKSGHAYFSLKDDESVLQCTCFGVQKTYVPKNGEKVILMGSVGYYQKGGRLSFNASSIKPYGIGEIMQRLEALKEKLLKEGLFDESHKKAIPTFVAKIAVVTSRSGAVIRDICRTIRNKNPLIDIYLVDTTVQGDKAANAMCESLRFADTLGVDVVVLARGGGSFEDLLPFYDEGLLRTIYSMNTPAVTAVGHETDTTFCDFVSDRRVATPTAAAELFYDYMETVSYIKDTLNRMVRGMELKYASCYSELSSVMRSITSTADKRLNDAALSIRLIKERYFRFIDSTVERLENRIAKTLSIIKAYNPADMLLKGYHRVEVDGRAVTDITCVEAQDKIKLLSTVGCIDATVDGVTVYATEDI